MKRIVKNLCRLLWYIPYRILKYLEFGQQLRFSTGWDFLYPFAPYSEGGLLKKDFRVLYKKSPITSEEYLQKKLGKFNTETNHYEFWDRCVNNQEYLQNWWPGKRELFLNKNLKL